jgi:hypothetical protein
MEKNKYFIQWSEYACMDEHHYLEEQPPVVRNLTDNELEEFCKGKTKIKVTFLKEVKE